LEREFEKKWKTFLQEKCRWGKKTLPPRQEPVSGTREGEKSSWRIKNPCAIAWFVYSSRSPQPVVDVESLLRSGFLVPGNRGTLEAILKF